MLKSNSRFRHVRALIGTAALASLLSGCSAIDQLKLIGQQPPLSPVDNPTAKPGYKPVQMPMPNPQPASYNPNSLWRSGSRAFFNDQRAHQVGDILTVKININDTAIFQDQTQVSRTATEDSGITNFIGANTLGASAAKAVLPGRILSADSNMASNGTGNINRQDQLLTNVAAVVTQLLPNANMVSKASRKSGSTPNCVNSSSPASCGRRTSKATIPSICRKSPRRASPMVATAYSPPLSKYHGGSKR